jgi:transposase
MARAYSEDLRLRVVEDVEAGASRRSVAARYRVSVSFVVKLVSRWRAVGTLKPRRVGGAKLHALAPHLELVRRLLAETPDLTLEELRLRLAEAGVRVGRSSVDRFLTARELTRKKRPPTPPSRRAPTSPRPAPPGGLPSPI